MVLLQTICIIVLIAILLFSQSSADVGLLRLIDLNKFPLATCLDATTPGGHYVDYSLNPANTHKIMLFFEGGAWTTTPKQSYTRSQGTLGSSKDWALTKSFVNLGILSSNTTKNPVFSEFNRVYIPYCDGTSHGGTETIEYNGVKLTHHGDYIVDAHLEILFTEMKQRMADAGNENNPEIVVAGCSAGGIASLLNTYKIRETAHIIFRNDNIKVVTIPCSGVFLEAKTIAGESVYPDHMRRAFDLAKPKWINKDYMLPEHPCFTKNKDDPAKCFFAQNLIPTMTTPVYILNSVYDSWSIPCIHTSKLNEQSKALQCGVLPNAEMSNCIATAYSAFVNCTAEQVEILRPWSQSFIHALNLDDQNEPSADEWVDFLAHSMLSNTPIYGTAGQVSSYDDSYNTNNIHPPSSLHRSTMNNRLNAKKLMLNKYSSSSHSNNDETKCQYAQQQQQHKQQFAQLTQHNDNTDYAIQLDETTGRVLLTLSTRGQQNVIETTNALQKYNDIYHQHNVDFPQQRLFTALSLPPLSGVFLHTCFDHCEGSKSQAFRIAIDGDNIPIAAGKWYTNVIQLQEKQLTTLYDPLPYSKMPCTIGKQWPFQCNPTCGA
eukprot:UN01546